MTRSHRLSVLLVSVVLVLMATTAPAQTRYETTYINNLHNPPELQNTDAYCTNLGYQYGDDFRGDLGTWRLPVNTSFGNIVAPWGVCPYMVISGTCTFKKERHGAYVTESTSITVTPCSSGKAFFENKPFRLLFTRDK